MKWLGDVSACFSIGTFFAFTILGSNSLDQWQMGVLLLALLASLFFMLTAYRSFLEERTRVYDTQGFYDFMGEWIKSAHGEIVIVSNKLSWGGNPKIQRILKEKAEAGNLQLIMKAKTEVSEVLQNSGAEVYYYSSENFVPKARFTMASADTGHSKVAVGWPSDKKPGKHEVHVFGAGKHPFVTTADDLITTLKHEAKNRRQEAASSV